MPKKRTRQAELPIEAGASDTKCAYCGSEIQGRAYVQAYGMRLKMECMERALAELRTTQAKEGT